MLHLVCILVCFSSGPALDDVDLSLKPVDVNAIITKLVARKPSDREVLFINMLYQVEKEVRTSDSSLKEIEQTLGDLSDNRFAATYDTDSRYRVWLLDAIQEMRFHNASKERDLQLLAQNYEGASQKMGLALNNVSTYKLLYLIRYLSTSGSKPLVLHANGKGITSAQLLVLLQEEHNSRQYRQSGIGQ